MRFFALITCLFLLSTPAFAQIEQTSIATETSSISESQQELQPFGSQLFMGQLSTDNSSGLNSGYRISSGDSVNLALWGAVSLNEALEVDEQGNIFVPDVGPINVQGVPLSQLNSHIEKEIRKTYKAGVKIYTNIEGTQPISIFVTGAVAGPGRYSGVATDTVLHYLDKAGGIDPERGSYRDIIIKRRGYELAEIDLYDFLKNGTLSNLQLKDGDTILVRPQHKTIAADGEVRNRFRFELMGTIFRGQNMIDLARPYPDVTHVSLEGVRDGAPYIAYVDLDEFRTTRIFDGDLVTFSRGRMGKQLTVAIEGQHQGQREMVIPLGTKLEEVLDYIPVNTEIANLDAIHVNRLSVAEKQKKALLDSLNRLEKKALSAQPVSATDASQRANELEFLEKFIEKAALIEPEGRVVVRTDNRLENILLENGDKIIIPAQTSLILVNGEVYDPKAIVFRENAKIDYYISKAGGFSDFADDDEILIFKPNGESFAAEDTTLSPGDEIIVMPKVPTSSLRLAAEIIDVIYKATIAAAVPFTID